MGKTVVKNSSGNTGSSLVPLSTPDRLVPDTHAHTHDGQRRLPRDRPDIRAQLTGSFTYVDQRFMEERHVVSITAKVRPSLPGRQTAAHTPSPLHS
jgi:hypothetical protein